jgi:hypothetical protein
MDDEGVTICAADLISKLVVLDPQARVHFPSVLLDVCWRMIPRRDGRIEDVPAEDPGP